MNPLSGHAGDLFPNQYDESFDIFRIHVNCIWPVLAQKRVLSLEGYCINSKFLFFLENKIHQFFWY